MEFEFKPLIVERCVGCKRFFFKGRMVKSSLKSIVKNHFSDLKIKSVVFDKDYDSLNKLPKKINAKIFFLKDDEEFFFDFVFSSKNFLCKDCQKKKSNYFEATLQLRNIPNNNIINTVKSFINELDDVVKEEKHFKNGVDFKITSNKNLKKILKFLEKNFLGTTKISSKLHTKDHMTQKEKHRLTGLFSFFKFQKDDVIVFENNVYLVKGIQKNNVVLFNLKNKSSLNVKSSSLKNFIKLVPFETVVVKTKPEIFILNEEFQDVKANSIVNVKNNDKVLAVNFKEEYFIIKKF